MEENLRRIYSNSFGVFHALTPVNDLQLIPCQYPATYTFQVVSKTNDMLFIQSIQHKRDQELDRSRAFSTIQTTPEIMPSTEVAYATIEAWSADWARQKNNESVRQPV